MLSEQSEACLFGNRLYMRSISWTSSNCTSPVAGNEQRAPSKTLASLNHGV
jgi:hypothetical protein